MPPQCDSLETQLRSSPVCLLRVVPDFITSFHQNRLGNEMMMLLFLGQESLDPGSLVRRHGEEQCQQRTPRWREGASVFLSRMIIKKLVSGLNKIRLRVGPPKFTACVQI